MTHPHEDEVETLLAVIAEQDSTGAATRQALLWCIDSRRMWRERALNAEDDVVAFHKLHESRDTVG